MAGLIFPVIPVLASLTTVRSGSGANWTAGGGFSFNGATDSITTATNQAAWVDSDGGYSFSDYLELNLTNTATSLDWRIGFYLASDQGNVNINSNRGGIMESASYEVWSIYASGDSLYYKDSIVYTLSPVNAENQKYTLKRNGGTITFYIDDVLKHTFATGSSAALGIICAAGNVGEHADDVNWVYG